MMHGFGLLMGSILAHPWAKGVVVKAQRLVSFFRASTRPMTQLREVATTFGIRTGFSSSNKTRLTSVHMCGVSVLALKDPLRSMVRQVARSTLPHWAIVLVEDAKREFWEQLEVLCSVLAPYSQVIMAVQSNTTTLADIVRYWIYLARELLRLCPHPFADRGTPSAAVVIDCFHSPATDLLRLKQDFHLCRFRAALLCLFQQEIP